MISNLEERARRAVQAAGFDVDFSAPEQRELEATVSSTRMSAPSDDATDLSALLWSSIDNDTSRDLDQVEVAEQLPQNAVRVRIGIADVDAFVPKNSLLDIQASRNTCSVYTGIETFPMLPRALSEDMTSLLPDQSRRAIVISYVVDPNGETSQIEIARATVRNRAELVYEDVGAWLDDAPGGKSSTRIAELETIGGLREQLLLQHEAATRLQKAREAKGALDLDSAQVTPIMKEGRVVGLQSQPKNAARRIIENFMVAANMALAQWLPEHGFSALARVVRTPERWPRIREIAQNLGDNLPMVAEPLALSEFLERQRKIAPENFAQLSLSVVKLLGPGNYELVRPQDKIGHFGLGAARYTHSTAPNRRFPDLVTQRLLKAALKAEQSPYSDDELAQIASRCNEREAAAQKVERLMRKVAAAALLHDKIGQVFSGVVTGASPKGVWVRTISPLVEGRVVQGERGLDVGDQVRVRLVSTDVERGFIDFARV